MQNIMKKTWAILMAMVMLLSFAACGGGSDGTAPPPIVDAVSTSNAPATEAVASKTESAPVSMGGYVEEAIPLDLDYANSMVITADGVYIYGSRYPQDMEDEKEPPIDETPADETPEEENPEDETPEGETPEGETPEEEAPASEAPAPNKRAEAVAKGIAPDAESGERLLLYKDGAVSWMPMGDIANVDIQNMSVTGEGKVVLLGSEAAPEELLNGESTDWESFYANRKTHIFTQGENGEFTPLGEGFAGDRHYDSVRALEEGGYALQSWEDVVILDAAGAQVRTISAQNSGIAVAGDTLYVVDTSDPNTEKVISYTAATGEKIEEIPITVNDNTGRRVYFSGFAADEKGNLYGYDQNGVYRHESGAEGWETIIEGVASIFGSGNFWSRNFGADAAGNIYACADPVYDQVTGETKESSITLYKYSWSDAVENKGEVLRIAGVADNQYIRGLANQFQRQHPEIKVEYTIYGTGYPPNAEILGYMDARSMEYYKQDMVGVEDGIRALNTEVLAGRSADIMILDGLPLDSYIEKGYLKDLTEWVNGRDADGTWMGNIVNAFKDENGVLPCLPISFSVSVFWGEKAELDKVKTLRDLADMAETLTGEEELWMNYGNEAVASMFFSTCYPDWVNEQGELDFSVPAFAEYLAACKTIRDTFAEAPNYETMSQEEAEEMDRRRWGNMLDGTTRFYRDSLSYRQDSPMGQAIMKKRDGETGMVPIPSQSEKRVFYPEQILGVSSTTANTELAYAFLDMVMDTENQKSWGMGGMPVNTEALQNAIRVPDPDENRGGGSMIIGGGSNQLEVDMEPITPETNAMMTALFDSLDTPVTLDWTLFMMFFEETQGFMEGTSDLNSAITALNSRARTYLME